MSQLYIQFDEIGILHRKREATIPRWRQDGVYKLVLGTQGTISFDLSRSRVSVPDGQFVLFNPEEKHQQIRCDGDKFLFEFSPRVVNEVVREVVGPSEVDMQFEATPVFREELTRVAKSLIPELYDPRPGQRIVLEHAAMQILVLAVRGVQSTGSDARRLETSGVQKAIHMMMECHQDPLSLDDIAAFAGMNKFSLIRQFREAVGVTPYEWLVHYRVHRVAEALSRTDDTVLRIALDHGFASVSAMNRQFRRLYGLSPAQWRQLYQGDIHASDENDADT